MIAFAIVMAVTVLLFGLGYIYFLGHKHGIADCPNCHPDEHIDSQYH